MKEFLEKYANVGSDDFVHVYYAEDVNPDAAMGDKWLENETSFIYRVGVLAVIDANKCDFVTVHIGHQREPAARYEYIGQLYWQDGENDDIGRCLRRYLSCLDSIHPVFHND